MFYLSRHKKEFAESKAIIELLKKELEELKSRPNLNVKNKTVLDFGYPLFNSIERALDSGKSANDAMDEMLHETKVVCFPQYGSIYIDKDTFLYHPQNSVMSLGQGNKGVNLVTDKPINMFKPVHERQQVSGFTAHYVGKEITKECAVVKLGDKLNKGGVDQKLYSSGEYHHWNNRTRSNGLILDFDFVGDEKYMVSRLEKSGKPKNPNFIPNSGAHAVWVDYANLDESIHSFIYRMKVRGYWKWVNTGIKITQKNESQTINALDIYINIWGSRQPMNINGVSLSKIKIWHQNQYMRDWNNQDPLYERSYKNDFDEWNLPSYKIKGSKNFIDVWDADLNTSGNNSGFCHLQGIIDVKKLLLGGMNELNNVIPRDKGVYTNADIKNSTLIKL